MAKSNYFPSGFRYPVGFDKAPFCPDFRITALEQRMEYLNEVHDRSGLPGHIFAAAMDLFQSKSSAPKEVFWDEVKKSMSMDEVVDVAVALAPQVQNEPERLDFPNAVALFDCRFISTKEWEHLRRYSIGGSEAATVLGLSHFQTPRSLYHEKRTPYDEEYDIGREQIFDYGHCVEPYIIEELATRLGAKVYPEYRMCATRS